MEVQHEVLFSIIVPVFNGEEHIRETIASLQEQTISNFEILVMDDGSTDNTADIVSSVAELDERIKLHRLKNGGAPSARNKGLKLAIGKYVAVNDADDLWPADRLADQYEVLRNNAPGIVIGGVQRFSVSSNKERVWGYTTLLPKNNLMGRGYVEFVLARPSNHMAIFHTLCGEKKLIETCGGWDEGLKSAEDWDFWLRLAQQVPFYHLDKTLLYYRKHSGSTTSRETKTRALECQLTIIQKVSEALPLSVWERRRYAGYRFEEAIKNYIHEGDSLLAMRMLVQAFFSSNLGFQKSFYSLFFDSLKQSIGLFAGKNKIQ